jgi:hypothetical protein
MRGSFVARFWFMLIAHLPCPARFYCCSSLRIPSLITASLFGPLPTPISGQGDSHHPHPQERLPPSSLRPHLRLPPSSLSPHRRLPPSSPSGETPTILTQAPLETSAILTLASQETPTVLTLRRESHHPHSGPTRDSHHPYSHHAWHTRHPPSLPYSIRWCDVWQAEEHTECEALPRPRGRGGHARTVLRQPRPAHLCPPTGRHP